MSSKVDSMLAIAYTVLTHPKNTYFWNINQISSLANAIIFFNIMYVIYKSSLKIKTFLSKDNLHHRFLFKNINFINVYDLFTWLFITPVRK